MKIIRRYCHNTLIVMPLLIAAPGVAVAEIYPFYFSNQNPFIQIFGLPKAEPAMLTSPGNTSSIVTLDIVNNTVMGDNTQEALVLDGETYRLNLSFKYGLSTGSEVGIDIPLVQHQQGRFDNFIRNWHDFFGLSNLEQQQFEANQLNYFYQKDGITILDLTEDEAGVGDLRLTYAVKDSYGDKSSDTIVYRASLKLPTGDVDKFLGSGSVDAGVSMAVDNDSLLREYHSELYGQLGLLWIGKSDHLDDVQRNIAFFGAAAIDWDYWRPVIFKAQLDVHSSFYRSDIEHIGGHSIQLTVGGSIQIDKSMHLDIGVTENLMTDATPDIGLNLSLWWGLDG